MNAALVKRKVEQELAVIAQETGRTYRVDLIRPSKHKPNDVLYNVDIWGGCISVKVFAGEHGPDGVSNIIAAVRNKILARVSNSCFTRITFPNGWEFTREDCIFYNSDTKTFIPVFDWEPPFFVAFGSPDLTARRAYADKWREEGYPLIADMIEHYVKMCE